MKTPIKIVVVCDLHSTEKTNGPLRLLPGKLDALLEELQPRVPLAGQEVELNVSSLDDLSVAGIRGQLNNPELPADALTEMLHNPRFQSFEASLRGLAYLAERLPEEGVQLEVLDTTYEELRGRFFDHIMTPEYAGKTEVPATLVLLDFDFAHHGESFDTFVDLAKMGEAIKAPVVAGTDAGFFGIKHLLHLPTVKNPVELFKKSEYADYQAFRQTETAFWASWMINRFLLRAPYTGDDYQEPVSAAKPEQYLWGRGIWILGGNLIRSYATKNHLIGLSGLGTGGEATQLHVRELPVSRKEKISTPLEAALPIDVVETLPYLGLSPLSQIPSELGGQHQPHMIYLHLAANMHHRPDANEQQFGALTVHTSLAYSLKMGRLSNVSLRFVEQNNTSDADTLKQHLLKNLWTKEEDEISVTAHDDHLKVTYYPHLVIHTRRFEVEMEIPV